jgi:hypothetical protein
MVCVISSNNLNFAITCHPLSVFTFFNYPSLPHFKSQWAQICYTYIPGFPMGERPFNIQIVQIRLILIFKNHTEVFSSETIDSSYIKPRNQIQFKFKLFRLICFEFLCKILKSENEIHASDYIIIGYCEPLVFNIHGY